MQNRNRNRNHSSSSNYVLFVIIIIFFFISCFIIIPIQSEEEEEDDDDGFSTELIHFNSPPSPFFNPNNEFGSSSLIHDSFLYVMKLSYGTPTVKYYQVLDTGSEISWIQCEPCIHCFQSIYTPFNHNHSRTFRFEKTSRNQTIPYHIPYVDNSYSKGELARETITLGSKKKFENFLFGCGRDNNGNYPLRSAGIVGFNNKERSFITQLRAKHGGRFSYCLAPPAGSHKAGKVIFGSKSMVSGNDVMTTPLIIDTHYHLSLDAITVGTHRLNSTSYISNYSKSNGVNEHLRLTIDTGTNVLQISDSLCSQVTQEVRRLITAKSPVNPTYGFKLCYPYSLRDVDIPKINLHFPGVVLELNPINTFFSTPVGDRCLAIVPRNGLYFLGNMAQINFLVAYNLVDRRISFKPANCARL